MSTLFFRQPRLVALTMLVLIAAGVSAIFSIGRQEDPTITNLFATITAVYPGAEPSRVEALVTEKIETELREVAEIDVIESTSASGIAIVNIELIDTLSDNRIEQVWADVRDRLDDAAIEFPPGVSAPELETDGAGAFTAISALIPEPGTSASIVQRYAESLADQLRQVSGTDTVELFGEIDEEILVKIDPSVLSSLSLAVDQVSAAISDADAKVQAGRLRTSAVDYVIEVQGEIDALKRVREIPITANDRTVARVGDIAEVIKGAKVPAEEFAFSSGQPAILVAAQISDDLQVDVWMQDIKRSLAQFESSLPRSIKHELVFDQSIYTAERLGGVMLNMAIGMVLVIVVLLFTLGARSALIVAMVLPLVTLASIATMNLFGLAIHQMSLTGLIVALGLLVDAAIVMTDEIRRRLGAGDDRLTAVKGSVNRLFAPLLASTLTTALSFMPMVLLPGPAGDFVGSIAIAVIMMLCWSFVIAITVTAAVAGWILPADVNPSSTSAVPDRGNVFTGLFRQSLAFSMRRPMSAVMLALVLPLLGFASAATLKAQFFPGVDRDQFYIEVALAEGSAIEHTRKLALAIDDVLSATDGIRQVSWVVGKSAPAFYYNMVADKDRAPEFAQALVTTASPSATAALVPSLQATLDEAFPAAQIIVRGLVQGPPVDAPVELRLVGSELEQLRRFGDELRGIVSRVEEVTAARTSLAYGPPKVSFRVDEDEARLAGFQLTGIARQLEAALEGALGGSLIEGTEELPIRVRVGDVSRADLNTIANLPMLSGLPNSSDPFAYDAVPLSSLADVTLRPAQSAIPRRNGERVNTVQAFLQYGVLPEEALTKVLAAMEQVGFELPEGYRLQVGGDSDARDDTLNSLLAPLGIIVTLSIASVVLTLNSFRLAAVTLVVAVLSAGLSMLALAVFQYPFGINAIIGVIGSIGVSINAAIIILTGLKQDTLARKGSEDAMVAVVLGSSRHIFSTTITTFGGFLPLILAGGGFWPPFAMSVAGGVLLSMVLSFYFTPPMFKLVYAGRPRPVRARIRRQRQLPDQRNVVSAA